MKRFDKTTAMLTIIFLVSGGLLIDQGYLTLGGFLIYMTGVYFGCKFTVENTK